MGCDIHFYTESRLFVNPPTLKLWCLRYISSDRELRRDLSKLPIELREQIYSYKQQWKWRFVHHDEYLEYKRLLKKGEEECFRSFTDFDGRSYALFGILANVRGNHPSAIAAYRGLPKDTTFPIRQLYKSGYDFPIICPTFCEEYNIFTPHPMHSPPKY